MAVSLRTVGLIEAPFHSSFVPGAAQGPPRAETTPVPSLPSLGRPQTYTGATRSNHSAQLNHVLPARWRMPGRQTSQLQWWAGSRGSSNRDAGSQLAEPPSTAQPLLPGPTLATEAVRDRTSNGSWLKKKSGNCFSHFYSRLLAGTTS